MTIVRLKKVTLIGHGDDKAKVVDDLQRLGCLHIIPLTADGDVAEHRGAASREALEALAFLASCPYQRRQVSDPRHLNALEVQQQALDLQKRLFGLREDRDYLAQRLKNLEPWGEFEFAPLDEMDGYRMWFFVVPKHKIGLLENVPEPWEVVNEDHRFAYVIVVSREEPTSVPFERTLTGARSPAALAERLEAVELEIEDTEAARAALTRWCTLFSRSLDGLYDHAERQRVSAQTFDEDPLFALRAWAPASTIDDLNEYAERHGMLLELEDPQPSDEPPTLFDNAPALRAGEDLVTFYRTPAYRLWDPSSVVFFSFAVFFAMIIADAGYGLMLCGVTAWLWRRLAATESGRAWRVLLATLSGTSIAYGVATGSYFGVAPDAHTLLARFRFIDIADNSVMMPLTIAIGGLHIIYASLRDAWRKRLPRGLASAGWAVMVVGGLLLGATIVDEALPAAPGTVAVVVGAALVLGFSGYGERPLPRALRGVLALTGVTKIFGDVLSYLRLFALGLASASLAVAFNDMAGDVRSAVPGIGLLFAILILVLGHALNFVLGLASAVIHGLRLNLLEFFDWGVPDEGTLFRAFRRKESE